MPLGDTSGGETPTDLVSELTFKPNEHPQSEENVHKVHSLALSANIFVRREPKNKCRSTVEQLAKAANCCKSTSNSQQPYHFLRGQIAYLCIAASARDCIPSVGVHCFTRIEPLVPLPTTVGHYVAYCCEFQYSTVEALVAPTRMNLLKHAKDLAQFALGRKAAGRGLTVFPDDIFIVSYLRSGSTWARFLFGNLVQDEPITFANVNQLVPLIYDLPDRTLRRMPRLLKSHECFDPRYPTVIHIVRDPRDVAVSFYYYNIKVGVIRDQYPIEDFIDRFIAARVVRYADRHGSWEDHTLSWVRLRKGKPAYRLVRYEDLLSSTASEVSKLIPLLRKQVSSEKIQRAVELSSVGQMRSLESKQWKQWDTTKNTRGDIPFVREAKSGGWQAKLSTESVHTIEQAWGPTMRELGYELTTPT